MRKERLSDHQVRELHGELNDMFLESNFPVYDTDKYIDLYKIYPMFRYAEYTTYEDYIDVRDIRGDDWAFMLKEERGNYPKISKIKSIVDYYGGKVYYGNDDIPPVPIRKVNGIYYLEEGNHRVYTLKYLLDKGLVKDHKIRVKVEEYDYNSFIKEADIIYKFDGPYLLINNYQLEEISEEEANRIAEIKAELDK